MASKIPESGKPDVSVVIVSYNGKDEIADCLHSVFKETRRISFEVIVSDNDSKDGCVGMIRSSFPSVRMLENKANLGFAAANNRAFNRCSGRYILLLNPDTFLQSDAISRMVAFMDANLEVGLCGPRLLNADGSLQHSARNFPSVTNQLAESFLLNKVFPRFERFGELILNPRFYSHTRHVDWVTGAALMIRRETLNDIGPLDERYFMYSEEKDWCYEANRKGWPVVFYPGAEIVHLHGESNTNPRLFKMLVHSKTLFLLKNYASFRAHVMIAIIRLNLAIRFAVFLVAMAAAAGIVPKSGVRDRLLRRLLVIRAGFSLLFQMIFILMFYLVLNVGFPT